MNIETLLKDELSKLIGKECWAISGGSDTGSVISVKITAKKPRKKSFKNPHLSELARSYDTAYSFLIYSPWRIENKSSVLCGSHHTNEADGPYQSSFNAVTGHTITSVTCEAPAFDLKMMFSNGTSLVAHCSLIGLGDSDECYTFYCPKGWITVSFDGILGYKEQ